MFGGIYYLGKSVSRVVMKENKVTGVEIEDKKIECSHLVLPANLAPETADDSSGDNDSNDVRVSRAVFVTRQSMLPSDKEQVTFLSLPQESGPAINVIEVGAGACATPRGLHLLHASGAGHLDLEMVMKTRGLVSEDSLVYSLSFTHSNNGHNGETMPGSNIWTAAGPAHELDFDIAIEQAKEIYKGMFPGEEFLPRAPDPEEIAFGDEETTAEETSKEETAETNNETKPSTTDDAD